MAYQALYRQWRPKDFSHMVGQEAIVETLRHQVQTGRIAHAYLFCGSRGTGKTSTAKILARAINCLNPRNGDPCGECEVCRRMQAEEYMDILEFDAASNSRVDDARDLLEKANFPPQFGRYKVYIIDEVHMLSTSAFNALLKTLEEPPEYLVFILATTEPYKLPATILSRCQRFDFGRIPAGQIQGRLKEAVDGAGGEATPGALLLIARAAEGGMRDALSILDMCLGYGQKVDETLVRSVLGTSDRAFLFRFSQALREEDAPGVIRMIDELIRQGKDPLIFSRDVSSHLRMLILAKSCGEKITEIMDLTGEDAAEYIREGENYSVSRLMTMLDLFMKLETDLRYSAIPRIALENVSLKCCLRTRETDTLALNDRIEELEGKLSLMEDRMAKGSFPVPSDSPAGGGTVSAPPKEKADPSSPAKAAAPVDKGAENVWKAATKKLRETVPGAFNNLLMGKFVGRFGDEFRWSGTEVHARILNQPDNREAIAGALSEAAGSECTFLAMDTSQALQKKTEASEAAVVRELREVFPPDSVTVVDSL